MWGYDYAKRNGIPVEKYPADWEKHGKRAGMLRNAEMGDVCDQALIFINETGRSNGTRNMMAILKDRKKPFYVFRCRTLVELDEENI